MQRRPPLTPQPGATGAGLGGAQAHVSVLRDEAVQALAQAADSAAGCFVDGTFGRGGHARALLARLGPQARLYAFDKDPEAIACAQALAAEDARLRVLHASFAAMAEHLGAHRGAIDGVLLDLGVSSPQIDNPVRGFSFRAEAALDMRMDTTQGETAAELLARLPEAELARLLRELAEERFARPIARAIVARREAGQALASTTELAALVAGVVKTREAGQHPATRTFQALRIAVNRELEDLEAGLDAALALLKPGGRLAVISFHSLEDRRVKQFIARESRDEVDRRAPFAAPKPQRLKAVARIMPGAAEVQANPRARSAVLRVAERTAVALQAGAGAAR